MTPSFPTQPSSDVARSYDRYRQAQVRWQSQFHLHGHSGIEMRYVVTHHFTQISKKACPAMIEHEAVALILLAAGRSTWFGVAEIGRASRRARVCQYVSISVVAVSLKKKTK